MHISLSTIIFGYTLGVFNTCTDNVSASLNWGSSKEFYTNLFSSFIPIGQTLGCIIATPGIDRIGRRKLLIYADVLFILGSVILVMPSTTAFGIGRILTGISTGIMSSICYIFVNEVTPVAMMPKIGPAQVLSCNIATVCSYSLGLTLPISNFSENSSNNLWIFMFLLPAALSGYQIAYFCVWMKHESPQFYLRRNMTSEAVKALEVTHENKSMNTGLRRINSDIQGKSLNGNKVSLLGMICEKKFRKMTRVAIILPLILQLSGSTVIIFYSTDIFLGIGGGLFNARLMTVIMGIVYVFSTASASYFLKYFGRKTLLITAQLMVSLDLTALGLCMRYLPTDPTVAAVFIILFFIPMGFGLDAAFWTFATEALNDQMLSFLCILRFTIATFVSYLFPTIASSLGIQNCFYFFAVCMLIAIVYTYCDLFETKNKTKEEILIEMRVISTTVLPVNSLDEECANDLKEEEVEEENLNHDQKKELEQGLEKEFPGFIIIGESAIDKTTIISNNNN